MNHNDNKRVLLALLIIGLLFGFSVQAATKAGTLIKNQASATYKDASGIKQFATSNIVATLVQPVSSMTLDQSQEKLGILGRSVSFSHVLKNTGNETDHFNLLVANNASDNFDLASFKIFADANKDGVADNTIAIVAADVFTLAINEDLFFVIEATLPATGAVANDSANFTVTARRNVDHAIKQVNIDTVKVTDQAVIDVTKSMSVASNESLSGPVTITLHYKNNGLQPATDVTLIDALPAGMTYVSGSGRWSVESATVLTDADDADDQSGVIYCAYDSSCTTAPIAVEQVTLVIASVPADGSGTLTFEVSIDSDLSLGTLYNTASYEYTSSTLIPSVPTNSVPFDVVPSLGVKMNGSNLEAHIGDQDNQGGLLDAFIVNSATAGEVIFFDNIVHNTGNSADIFDITINAGVANPFPNGTTFSLYKKDGRTPLLDNNSNGVVDTGLIAAGARYKVILRAELPHNATAGNNTGNGFNVEKMAMSSFDATIFDTVMDRLTTITALSVDLTNNAAIGGVGVLGVGTGPEATALTTINTAAGKQAIFKLYVNNTGGLASEYILQYSHSHFAAGVLEPNWKASFYVDGGAGDCSTLGIVTEKTGLIPANSSRLICAGVTVPVDALADGTEHPIYFKVKSLLTGVFDIKHDAVTVAKNAGIAIEPDQFGQVRPGSAVTYSHLINNIGNKTLECIAIASVNNREGWNSIIYVDVNNDRRLDSGDTLLTDKTLTASANFSIIIKVFSPANESQGAKNITTLSLTAQEDNGVAGCSGTVLTGQSIDMTTTNPSKVAIVKTQSLDANCDGTADSAFVTETFPVNPKECVIYQLMATNQGSETVHNVRIDDATPSFTIFNNSGALPTMKKDGVDLGAINGGVTGTTGDITGGTIDAGVANLKAGESMTLIFSIKLD
ncbi:MAG: DUF11 domain-containing protein [Thiotrichaceae bacterium]|nr:DUF11 domain-containing protein [Thiotrichaceae bacterium]